MKAQNTEGGGVCVWGEGAWSGQWFKSACSKPRQEKTFLPCKWTLSQKKNWIKTWLNLAFELACIRSEHRGENPIQWLCWRSGGHRSHVCQVLRHQSRLSRRNPQTPNPTTSIVPCWPSRIQWGDGALWGPKTVLWGFYNCWCFTFKQHTLSYSPQNVRLCVRTHNSANGFPGKKKTIELEEWVKGGQMRVGITEQLSPLCHVVSRPSEQGERGQSTPICGRPHPQGVYLCRQDYDGFKVRRPVGHVAKEDFFQRCCCFCAQFVSSEQSF